MKLRSGLTVKAVIATGLFLFAGTLLSHAQSNNTTPSWTTSKDVQRYANKQLFNDEALRNSHIRITSVSPTWNISKGVHRKKGDELLAKGNVSSKEYPTWLISKGVQQIGRK